MLRGPTRAGLASALAAGALAATPLSAAEYPLGAVAAPAASGRPSPEQQGFHYRWLRHAGLSCVQNEAQGVAGGWLTWDFAEPEPGRYRWDAFESVVRDAEAAGIDAVLQVYSWRGVPPWVYEQHPDAYMHTPLGGSNELHRVVHDEVLDIPRMPCIAHPAIVEGAAAFVRALATHFRDRTGVKGYFIGDEFGLNNVWPPANYYGIDFAPAMVRQFQQRLEERFGSVAALNETWDCPERYAAFDEITWNDRWPREPAAYRNEWITYYAFLQERFADLHNRLAREIHAADPDALVIASGYELIGYRIGHGAYLPRLTEVDAVAYKSYWHDNRLFVDWCAGISGDKQVWCSNWSERETTTGPVAEQRYQQARYLRTQFWPAYARGLDGLFLWIWSAAMPDAVQRMNLLDPQADGSLDTIGAVTSVGRLSAFLRRYYPELARFRPRPPRVAVLDPNLTYIATFWEQTDPDAIRGQHRGEHPTFEMYRGAIDVLVDLNLRFTVQTDETTDEQAADEAFALRVATGCDYLPAHIAERLQRWADERRSLVIDSATGRYNERAQQVDALAGLAGRSNVLVLTENWATDNTERDRLENWIRTLIPSPHRIVASPAQPGAGPTIDLMEDDDGAELAVITRRGRRGHADDRFTVRIAWARPHGRIRAVDPFAARPDPVDFSSNTMQTDTEVALEGFQDVLLVLAE